MKTLAWKVVGLGWILAAGAAEPVTDREAGAEAPAGAEAVADAAPAPAAAVVRRANPADLPRPAGDGPIVVLPVEGQIEGALVYVFRRGLREAEQSGARAVLLDMDTPGGSLSAVWSIMELLQRSPVPTYTYVNPNGISGGALLALATDHIVMAPGALIGDAKPILGSPLPMGTPQDIPEGLREKVLSPALAKLRSASQRTGRASDVGEAMMDETLTLERDGKVICEVGRILTLTDEEAATLYGDPPVPLLSEGTFATLDELLNHLKGDDPDVPVHTLRVSSAERIARVLAGPLSPLLLGLGLLLLYIEVRSPGFGIPGLTGLLLMALWFWGQHIAMLAGMGEVVVFLLGLVLLGIELFLIPGFGVTGIVGVVLMIGSLIAAMVTRLPGGAPLEFPAGMLTRAITHFALAMGIWVAGMWAAGGLLPRLPAFRRLTLSSVIDGHSGADASATLQPGLRGVTLSPCRPGGVGQFGAERVDIVSNGVFLAANTPVELVSQRGIVWEVRAVEA